MPSWFVVELVTGEPAPETQPEFGGGHHPGTYGPLLRGQQEISLPAEVVLGRQVEIPYEAAVELRRLQVTELRQEIALVLNFGRPVELSVSAIRTPGTRLSRISREDDELLLLMG